MKKINLFIITIFGICLCANAQNIPRPNIPAPKGLTVNSYTGNVFYQRTDLTLRGVGYPIYSTFYYNAVQDTMDYGYGKGWSFYYNIFYKEISNTVIIQYGDAKKDTFTLAGAVYKSPTGIYDSLYKSGSTFILKQKSGQEYSFDNTAHKKVTKIKNRNGNYVSIDYTAGYPIKIRNSSGRCLLLNWSSNHLSSVSDSALPAKSFSYTYKDNNLSSVTDPLNGKMQYAYSNRNIVRIIDENNNPVVLLYNGSRVKQIKSCNSNQQFSYIDTLKQTFATINSNASTSVTAYVFDEKGRIKELVTPDYKKLIYTYDTLNNIIQIKDPKNNISSFTYSNNGNLLAETDVLGFKSEYTYNSLNKISSIKDKKGNITTLAYDANGNVDAVTKPGNITETYTYNAQGQLLTTVNGNGKTTTYTYNADGDLTKIQSPIGTQLFEYGGGCCNLSKITDANGNNAFMTYDLMNRLLSVKDDQNNTTAYEYDAAGNIVKETDPNGNIKLYGYDAANQLTSVQVAIGTWHYEYDGAGDFTKMTDAKGNVYRYEYDINNRLTKETDPLGNTTTYTYDDNGNLLQKKEPKGNTISFKYDEANRLTERSYDGNTDQYSYDANGNMVAAYNSNIAYSFEYDALNRMIKKIIPSWGKAISYTYDSVGNRKTMTDPDGGITRYVYDANNRLTNLTNPANLTTTFVYDAGGRLKRQNNANGTYSTYTYDAGGKVDSILHRRSNGDTIAFNFYTFDQFGNRLTMKDKRGLHKYTYDAANRLTNVLYADGSTESFAMDANGNRTLRTKNGSPVNYAYNNADQIISAGTANYNFDANGNMIANTETGYNRTLTYDGLNRLTQVQVTAAKKWQVKYDPFGEKIERIDTNNALNKMLYDGENLLGELNSSNAFITKYTTALGTDSWLMQQQAGNNYYYHKDGLNSATILTNATGSNVNEYQYDVYGNITLQTGALYNPVQYTGRLKENSLGMYDYRSRMYNASVGRFINKDCLDGVQNRPNSLNKFSYTENNPVNYLDANGRFIIPLVAIALEASAIAASRRAIMSVAKIVVKEYIIPELKASHLNRNCSNESPSGSPTDAIYQGWEIETNPEKTEYHQRNPDDVSSYDRQKYTKTNSDGSSSEAIWDLTENRWLKSGENGGPSFNFIHPTNVALYPWREGPDWKFKDYYTAIGHTLLDIVPHKLFGGNYSTAKCSPKPKSGSQDPTPKTQPGNKFTIITIRSKDPNEIVGTLGYDTTVKWVSATAQLPYKILFENDPDFATASAQKVTIYCPIDTLLNPNSFRLGNFGFGSFNFTVPPNSSIYTSRLDVRDSLGVFVDITAGLDITNRRAFWVFESIDPATGLAASLPANGGFLPVNDSITHNGEGYVNFTIQPLSSCKTRDSVKATGTIIFDDNETINTNTWKNTIDAVAPISSIKALPTSISTNSLTIKFTGKDDTLGSGIKDYTLYYAMNNGTFMKYSDATTTDSIVFTGDKCNMYGFYVTATDNTGNTERKTAAEQTVSFGSVAKKDTINLTGCDSVIYNGVTFKSSISKSDTLKTQQGCDSIYRQIDIAIKPSILGNVKHPTKGGINNVSFKLFSTNTSSILSSTNYKFNCLTSNSSGYIKPTKNNDISKANGVNTTDVLFVQRHILNTAKLNNAYKLIAADVNGDKQINSTDILRIKRLILGTDTTFTKGTGANKVDRLWEFVDSAFQFPDTTNPFPFKDSISFTNLISNKINQTFIGVKLGDVNYDWNAAMAKNTSPSNSLQLIYLITNQEPENTNSNIRIPVTVNQFKDIVAMQYTIHFDVKKYEFVGIENNELGIDFNDDLANKSGNIAMLWTDKSAQSKTLEDGTHLLVLVFRSIVNDFAMKEIELDITNNITEVVAWDKDLNQHNIILTKQRENNGISISNSEYWSISPNPTDGDIRISIICKTKKNIQFEISDAMGKTIEKISYLINKGNNIISINLKEKKNLASGIYFIKAIGIEGDNLKKVLISP